MEHWYLVQTKSRQESVAEENLRRQDYRVLFPRIRQSRRRRGRWQDVVEPMFPGYLFVHLNLQTNNSAPIRSTRGVVGLVRFGADPMPVPDAVVEGLQANADDSGAVQPVFKPGEKVTILEGSFAGMEAIFKAESGEERVVLLLDLLGRSNSVTLSRHHIAPV